MRRLFAWLAVCALVTGTMTVPIGGVASPAVGAAPTEEGGSAVAASMRHQLCALGFFVFRVVDLTTVTQIGEQPSEPAYNVEVIEPPQYAGRFIDVVSRTFGDDAAAPLTAGEMYEAGGCYPVFPEGTDFETTGAIDAAYIVVYAEPYTPPWMLDHHRWRIIGYDCPDPDIMDAELDKGTERDPDPGTGWTLDTSMNFDSTQSGLVRYRNWDEFVEVDGQAGNPYDWDEPVWFDDWDPVTRIKQATLKQLGDGTLRSSDPFGTVPEYLPAAISLVRGSTITLQGNTYEVGKEAVWARSEDRVSSQETMATVLRNTEDIDSGWGITKPGDFEVFYHSESGLLLEFRRTEELLAADLDDSGMPQVTGHRLKGMSLQDPDYGARAVWGPDGDSCYLLYEPPPDPTQKHSYFSMEVDCGHDEAAGDLQLNCSPWAGDDTWIRVYPDEPDQIQSIHWLTGPLAYDGSIDDGGEVLCSYDRDDEIASMWRVDESTGLMSQDCVFRWRGDAAFEVWVWVTDRSGNQSKEFVHISPVANRSPMWAELPLMPVTRCDNDPITFNPVATDPDEHDLRYRWFIDGVHQPVLDELAQWTWEDRQEIGKEPLPPALDWTATVAVEVSDDFGGLLEYEWSPPQRRRAVEIVSPASFSTVKGTAAQVDVKVYRCPPADTATKTFRAEMGVIRYDIAVGSYDQAAASWKIPLMSAGDSRLGSRPQLTLTEDPNCSGCGVYTGTLELDTTKASGRNPLYDRFYRVDFRIWDFTPADACPLSWRGGCARWRYEDGTSEEMEWDEVANREVLGEQTTVLYFGNGYHPAKKLTSDELLALYIKVVTGIDVLAAKDYFTGLWNAIQTVSACAQVAGDVSGTNPPNPTLQQALAKGVGECSVALVSVDGVDQALAAENICDIVMEAKSGNRVCALSKIAQMVADNTNVASAPLVPAYLGSEAVLNSWGCANSLVCNALGATQGSTTAIKTETTKDLDLHAVDRFGRHVGVDYATGRYDIEIPGATGSGDTYGGTESITVPGGLGARFYVDASGAEEATETYTFRIEHETLFETATSGPIEQVIQRGEVIEHSYSIAGEVGAPSVVLTRSAPFTYGNGICDRGETIAFDPIDCDTSPPTIGAVTVPQEVRRGDVVEVRADVSDDGRLLVAMARVLGEDGLVYDVVPVTCPTESGYRGRWDTARLRMPGVYHIELVAYDEAENSVIVSGPTVTVTGTAAPMGPGEVTPALYPWSESEAIGDALTWPDAVPDPQEIYEAVAHLRVGGFARGETADDLAMLLDVPSGADIASIPLATALNGDVTETDSEAGIVITVRDPATGEESVTYASGVMNSYLGAPYLYGFADVSPFVNRTVELHVTLLQPHACAGSNCTHDIDLYVGPVRLQSLPDVCTSQPDGSHLRHDYPGDPTPETVAGCSDLPPTHFVEASIAGAVPFERFGAGADSYETTVSLPDDFALEEFCIHYGDRIDSLTINGTAVPADAVRRAFPVHRPTNNRLESAARYSFVNRGAAEVAEYFVPGDNTIAVVISADDEWDERPFSLYARFRAETREVVDDVTAPVETTPPSAADPTIPEAMQGGAGDDDGGGAPILFAGLALAAVLVGGGVLWVRRRRAAE